MKLNDKVYDVLKWFALIVLNAVGVCYILPFSLERKKSANIHKYGITLFHHTTDYCCAIFLTLS